jgi:hypothetical protein
MRHFLRRLLFWLLPYRRCFLTFEGHKPYRCYAHHRRSPLLSSKWRIAGVEKLE